MNRDFIKRSKNRSRKLYDVSNNRESLPPIYPPVSAMSNNMTAVASTRGSDIYSNLYSDGLLSSTYRSSTEDTYRREMEAIHISRLNQIRDDVLVDATPRREVQKGSHHPL